MFHDHIDVRHEEYAPETSRSWVLQLVLWSGWTTAVAGVAYVSWHADRAGQRPINLVGMGIHCALAGLVGLVVLTLIEMRLEPWRFMEDEQVS